VKRLFRIVLFASLFLAPATNFVPLSSAKAIPAGAQQNPSKHGKKSKAKSKPKKSKTHTVQRRQRKHHTKPA